MHDTKDAASECSLINVADGDVIGNVLKSMDKAAMEKTTINSPEIGTPGNPKKQILSQSFVIELEDDEISSPTVSCASFSDEEFSIASHDSETRQKLAGITQAYLEENDDLSMTSMNTKAIRQIQELRKKLRIQENTKLELLKQCMKLDHRIERDDSKSARVRIYKTENNKLREQSAHMERDFMNEMNKIVAKMAELERKHEEEIKIRDEKVKRLEEDLQKIKGSKEFEDVKLVEDKSEERESAPLNRTMIFKSTSEDDSQSRYSF
mmetsp:Transcript_2688/g.3078  ORF Transcript_2688/g.3078 Transcript_2688/m.3078 type:complete len:266 (+) Transcript_2688:74-871(+)